MHRPDPRARSDATWVVRRHTIEYRRPAFAGDRIDVRTWVTDCRMVSSRRKYEFIRATDSPPTLLARGETDWVLLDLATLHPKAIPQEMQDLYNPPRTRRDAAAPRMKRI